MLLREAHGGGKWPVIAPPTPAVPATIPPNLATDAYTREPAVMPAGAGLADG
jgi:hypothetical protein